MNLWTIVITLRPTRRLRPGRMVRKERLELSRVTPLDPKSSASTNSATFARRNRRPTGSAAAGQAVQYSGFRPESGLPAPSGAASRAVPAGHGRSPRPDPRVAAHAAPAGRRSRSAGGSHHDEQAGQVPPAPQAAIGGDVDEHDGDHVPPANCPDLSDRAPLSAGVAFSSELADGRL